MKVLAQKSEDWRTQVIIWKPQLEQSKFKEKDKTDPTRKTNLLQLPQHAYKYWGLSRRWQRSRAHKDHTERDDQTINLKGKSFAMILISFTTQSYVPALIGSLWQNRHDKDGN